MTEGNPRTVRVARLSATVYYAPLWFATERGMSTARGIDVAVEQIGDSIA